MNPGLGLKVTVLVLVLIEYLVVCVRLRLLCLILEGEIQSFFFEEKEPRQGSLTTVIERANSEYKLSPGNLSREADLGTVRAQQGSDQVESQCPSRTTFWSPVRSSFSTSSWPAILFTEFSKSFNFFSSTSSSGLV